jgi:hypothetical protein
MEGALSVLSWQIKGRNKRYFKIQSFMNRFLFVILLCLSLFVRGQTGTGTISGVFIDSATTQPLYLATVTLYSVADTAVITYRLTNESGGFKMGGIPKNQPFYLLATFTGYRVFRKEIKLTSGELDIGRIRLQRDTTLLENALVAAERPPVIIRNDTIEFNAAAFKTFPDALVEDLLKKLPGVEVDSKGNITFQGRPVTQIKVDGRDFFGNNPKVASRNLPANIIERVQVTDDMDDKMTHPNAPEWEIGKVINLKLKKEVRGGLFGKVYAGGGTDDKYQAGGILNTFRDTLQASLIGYANNLSQPAAFSADDMLSLAGFQRSGFNNMNLDFGGSVTSIDNTSFGGNGTGIQTSNAVGANINEQFGAQSTANLQYFYNHTDNQISQMVDTKQWYSDTVLHSISNSSQENGSNANQLTAKLTEQFSPVSKLVFTPLFSTTANPSGSLSTTGSSTQYSQSLNNSTDINRISDNHAFYKHELLYTNLRLKKQGRTFTISNSLIIGSEKNNQYTNAQSDYLISDTAYLNQLRQTNSPEINGSLSVSYVEPLTKRTDATFVTSLNYFRNEQSINTFNPDPSNGKYVLPVDTLSSRLTQTGIKSMTRIGIDHLFGKSLSFSPGILLQTIDIDNNVNPGHIHQDYQWVLPYLSLTWNRMLRFSYTSQLKEPPVNDLITTVNNTNPLYQTLGNPFLTPTLSHLFNLSFNKYVPHTLTQISARIYATINQNYIASATSVTDSGVQITRPFNTNDSWKLGSTIGFGKQYKSNQNWQFSFRISVDGNWRRDLVLVNGNESRQDVYTVSPRATLNFNWKDIVVLDELYNLSYVKSNYELNYFQNISYAIQTLSSYLHIVPSPNYYFETSLIYQYNPENGSSLRKSNILWNGSINYKFLPHRQATLKLSIYDALNQNNGLQTLVSQNFIESIQTTTISRYYMLIFIYDVRKFSKAKPYRGIFNF